MTNCIIINPQDISVPGPRTHGASYSISVATPPPSMGRQSVAGLPVYSWVDWSSIKWSVLLKNIVHCLGWESKPQSCDHECNAFTTRPHIFTSTVIIIIIITPWTFLSQVLKLIGLVTQVPWHISDKNHNIPPSLNEMSVCCRVAHLELSRLEQCEIRCTTQSGNRNHNLAVVSAIP